MKRYRTWKGHSRLSIDTSKIGHRTQRRQTKQKKYNTENLKWEQHGHQQTT